MKKLTLFFSLLLFLSACGPTTTADFAQCLAEKDTKFYGAFWCPNCLEQKKLFEDAVEDLPYIECDPDGKNSQAIICDKEGITQYPTWVFADGTRKKGVQSLESLSELTGCALPEETT